MKTRIQTHKEGKYFIAIDLITNIADQGLTESEAVSNLKKGLEEHYQVLLELAPKGRKLSFLDIEGETRPGFRQSRLKGLSRRMGSPASKSIVNLMSLRSIF
jgi:predicted RNase H-like HicB family nuclease